MENKLDFWILHLRSIECRLGARIEVAGLRTFRNMTYLQHCAEGHARVLWKCAFISAMKAVLSNDVLAMEDSSIIDVTIAFRKIYQSQCCRCGKCHPGYHSAKKKAQSNIFIFILLRFFPFEKKMVVVGVPWAPSSQLAGDPHRTVQKNIMTCVRIKPPSVFGRFNPKHCIRQEERNDILCPPRILRSRCVCWKRKKRPRW